jgi:hypothetical protein
MMSPTEYFTDLWLSRGETMGTLAALVFRPGAIRTKKHALK